VIKDGAVTGVTVIGQNGKELTFSATKEVIVSSGVFESPKLLMLSGIGPDEVLKAHDIKQVVASQHVGKNLLDHPIMPHVFKLKDGLGLDDHLLRAGPMKAGAIATYQKNRTGPLSSGLLELVGFPRIDERLLKYKEYRAAKEKNGGLDPFGPGGQPHFEIDFVVCCTLQPEQVGY
jgi:choline dehydrogenase